VRSVDTEHLLVEPDDRREILRGRGPGGDLRPVTRGDEVAAQHLGVTGDLEPEFLVQRAAVRGRVQGEGGGAHRRDDVPHEPASHSPAGMPFGDQDHADGRESGLFPRAVLGDDAGGHQTTVGIVDAVPLPGRKEEAPLVLLPWPPPVLGQVGAGGEVAKRQTADGQRGKGRCRHAGQAVRQGGAASTRFRRLV
jgi:hypothetical protein